jgi:hypothetical protein
MPLGGILFFRRETRAQHGRSVCADRRFMSPTAKTHEERESRLLLVLALVLLVLTFLL